MKVNERRTVVGGGVDWPLCVPQPWREIDAHVRSRNPTAPWSEQFFSREARNYRGLLRKKTVGNRSNENSPLKARLSHSLQYLALKAN